MDDYPIQEYYPTSGVWDDEHIADIVRVDTSNIAHEEKSYPASSFCIRAVDSLNVADFDYSMRSNTDWTYGHSCYRILSPEFFKKPNGTYNDADLLLTNFRMTFIFDDCSPANLVRHLDLVRAASTNEFFTLLEKVKAPAISSVSLFLFKGVYHDYIGASDVSEFIRNGCELLTSVHSTDRKVELNVPQTLLFHNERLYVFCQFTLDKWLCKQRMEGYFDADLSSIYFTRFAEGNAVIIEQVLHNSEKVPETE